MKVKEAVSRAQEEAEGQEPVLNGEKSSRDIGFDGLSVEAQETVVDVMSEDDRCAQHGRKLGMDILF